MANSATNFAQYPAPATWGYDIITTNESTSSTNFTDLATVGPTVTLVTGTKAVVFLSMTGYRASGVIQTQYMGVRITDSLGNEILAAGGSKFIAAASRGANILNSISGCIEFTGLPPGKKIFTAKYKVDGSTFNFYNRSMFVMVY